MTDAQEENSTRPRGEANTTARVTWIDAAKGIGILAVVIGHVLGGLIDSPLGEGQLLLRQVFFGIYAFHMPLFFVLSGLLVKQRVERGPRRFLKGLLPSIVLPYFIWSVIQFSVTFVLGSLVNHPADNYWEVVLALPWRTVGQFWFLHALFCMHVLAAAVLPAVGAGGLLLLAIALKGGLPLPSVPGVVAPLFQHTLFYATGVVIGVGGFNHLLMALPAIVRTVVLPAATIGLLVCVLGNVYAKEPAFIELGNAQLNGLASDTQNLFVAVLGILSVLGIAYSPTVNGLDWLLALGRNSMAIFVLHILFLSGTRIVMLKVFHSPNVGLMVLLLTLVGVIGPLVAVRILKLLPFHRYLGV